MLSITNLTKVYGQQRAVDNISFSVGEGEVLGFLGPNGAGKSTTMKIATTYLPPTSGQVTVYGHDVTSHSLEVRRLIGYLPEHNPLYLDMYVHEYLQFIGHIHSLKGQPLKAAITDVIERTGLGREQNKKIGALSKGYRQRVGLAQAMLHDPKVLILDEPTSGLDPNQIVEIRQLIKEAGRNRTVIFSTHILQEVQAVCDRVVIINRGQLVADSSLADIQAQQSGKRVYIAEFETAVSPKLLQEIPGIEQVRQSAGNALKYELIAKGNTDARAAIFKHAAEHNLTLLGLQQQENSLETIFRNLTGNSPA